MESTLSLRSFVRHLMAYAMILLRKSVLDSAEGASMLVAKLVALLIISLIVPVCMVLVAFLFAYLISDLLGGNITLGVLLTLLLLIGIMVVVKVWYKPLTRPIRDRVKALFIEAANHCKSSKFEDELGKDLDAFDPLEDPFDGDEEA